MPPDPTTPRKPSARRASNAADHVGPAAPTMPVARKPSATTPNSAPAAATKKPSALAEGTLLGDFLRGRPSPQRQAMMRQQRRRSSVEPMGKKDVSATPEKDDSGGNKPRQASVQRLAGPKRVQDRVKEWQKMNARAMAGADPERAPTEPSDVVKKADDEESVTEEDRVRIKFRQQRAWERQRRKSMGAVAAAAAQVVDVEPPSAKKERVAAEKQVDAEEGVDDDPRRRSPPKKRIVSDDNWLKAGPGGRRKASPDEGAGKMAANKESTAAPIPKDFLERTARNPSPSDKVRQWAEMVEPPSPKEASKLKGSSVVDTDAEYDGIRVKPIGGDEASERTDTDVAVRDVSPQKRTPAKPKVLADDDGIRVTPIRKSKAKEKEKPVDDDGIRVRPIEKSPAVQEDDGIRVRTIPRQPSIEDDASTVRETTLERQRKIPSPKRRQSVDRDTVADDPLDTPTKKRPSRGGERMMVQADDDAATVTEITQQTGLSTEREEASEKESPSSRTRYSDEDERNSYMMAPSTAPQKSLAEIPFGYSAFSELDLPLGADAGILKRPKATSHQHPSFKAAVPKVFKKVVSGTQKIIHDKVDPPKPVVNQPPSIESWLNKTIDPFVSAGAGQDDAQGPAAVPHKRRSVEKEWEEENRERRKSVDMHERAKRRLSESRSNAAPVPQREAREEARGEADSEPEVEQPKPAKKADKPNKKPFTPPLSGLKRSKATRVAEAAKAAAAARKSSGGGGIRFFSREAWRDVFSGESALKYPKPPKDFDDDYSDDYTYTDTLDSDSRREGDLRRRYSSESGDSRSPRSPPRNEELRRQFEELTPKRKPPTNGAHELSTIVSVETASTHESEVSSVVSQTTITQETALPRDKYGYPDLSPRGSRKDTRSPSGLRRRFTKHSDLMSMLSLPDEAHENTVMRSTMYRTRSRRHCGPGTTIEDLLMDFAEDENFYRRELKALIEGVVPVLLNQMVHGDRATSSELFGGADATPKKVDSMIKAMVDMAMALEKLKSQHIRAPLADYPGLLSWLDTVVPTYQNYLDVWRLGFHGIVVNLAPAPGRPDDEDSLVNALPRNEDGDVINDQGERIDVAYLLKRPQARIKRILKFIRACQAKKASSVPEHLVAKYEALEERIRTRQREERERLEDEDASCTDTTRTRDLRTLALIDNVRIDDTLQVLARDTWNLEQFHSSGQKLGCQVELVFRVKQQLPDSRGDVLIREVEAHGQRSWLLYPPVPHDRISARLGERDDEIVIMIRGTHNSREWYELITLGGDSDEQAKEWLSLLGTTPVPPMRPQSPSGRPQFMDMTPSRKEAEVPIGARKLQKPAPTSPRKYSATVEDDADSSRFRGSLPGSHPRGSPLPCTPDQRSPPVSYGATQPQYGGGDAHIIQLQGEAGSSELSKLRKQLPNSSSFRADGAPPPPVHRTFGPKRMDITPVAKPQRRNSSPLKHEYRPDEQSSSGTDTASITSSSTDDSDAVLDLPETLPGISIKHGLHESPPTSVSSRTPSNETSDSSLAPSNSASQASPLTNIPAKQPDGTVTLVASVSHWSNRKGGYRDLEGKAWNENVPSEPYSIVITPGLLEVFPLGSPSYQSYGQALQASGDSDISENAEMLNGTVRPLIALDLTPLVMIRQSNLTDVEIRSHVRSYSKYNKIDSGIFRFRSPSIQESQLMYQAVHTSRMNNRKYKLLEEQNRIRNFGQNALQDALKTDSAGGDDTSSRRRSFFGFGRRGGSYRASARGPASTSNHQTAQSSHGGSTSMSSSYSASSFLRRLMGGGDGTFDITGSTVQRMAGLPTDLESSTYEGEAKHLYDADSGFKIKCFMMVGVNKWEDYGPCELWITKPEPGMHQASNIYHGMQKRITVTRTIQTTPIAKAVASVAATVFRDTAVAGAALTAYGEGHKITRGVASATIGRPGGPLDNEKGRTSETNNTATAESPRKPQSHDVHAAAAALGREVVMDFVVGSDNFTRIGTRGICLNVWEDIYHPELGVGRVPAKGGVAGTVKKWMFACSSTDQANFIYKRLVTEVEGVIG